MLRGYHVSLFYRQRHVISASVARFHFSGQNASNSDTLSRRPNEGLIISKRANLRDETVKRFSITLPTQLHIVSAKFWTYFARPARCSPADLSRRRIRSGKRLRRTICSQSLLLLRLIFSKLSLRQLSRNACPGPSNPAG